MVCFGLASCSQKAPAPVFDLYSSNQHITKKSSAKKSRANKARYSHNNQYQSKLEQTNQHTVKPGDTLFSIAWYYSVSVESLVVNNKLKNNRIYPGQKLTLRSQKTQASEIFDPESLVLALNNEVLAKPIKSKVRKPLNTNRAKNKRSTKKHSNSKLAVSASNNLVDKRQSSFVNKKPIKNNNLNWIWPADGSILSRFSNNNNANRGLDIAGSKGQAVRASAPGKVVYEGNGLKGYGNLVIIKHDNNYLSAYAHNDKVYVSENEVVKAGQRIADIGDSGTKRTKLHFEIRYKGKPVDPLNYLPQRKI